MKAKRFFNATILAGFVLAAAHAAAGTSTASTNGNASAKAQHRAILEANAARARAAAEAANARARKLDRIYNAARVTDFAMHQTVKQIPGGGTAYSVGRATGDYLVKKVPKLAQPVHFPR